MPEVTISEFATDVGVSVERIQEQLVEAGLPNKKADEVITESEKSELLGFLRKKHGKDENSEPRKITLRRKTVSELKVPVATQGRAKPRSKTVNIEFRKRRTYAKRGDVAETLKQEEDAAKLVEEQAAAELKQQQQAADAEAKATEAKATEAQNEAPVVEETITEEEITFAKSYLIRRYPSLFETYSQVATNVSLIPIFKLPTDYFGNYISNINEVTLQSVTESANNNILDNQMVIVIVGDIKKIRLSLENFASSVDFEFTTKI